MNTNKAVHAMARVRELATRHAAEELEHCLAQAIAHGDNACISDGAIEERINALARAGFVNNKSSRAQHSPTPCANWAGACGQCKVTNDGGRDDYTLPTHRSEGTGAG